MAIHHRPPVIPEIQKAYQNDPATKLAIQALTAGTSTAPVARGSYGTGDGIARIAQALIGAKLDQTEQNRYGDDEDKLLALRQARGVDGLSGQPPPVAPAVAAALGAPAPPPATSGPPPIPSAPAPPPGPTAPPPAMAPPQQGGGPNGQVPFGSAGRPTSGPAFLPPPIQETVPDKPAPVARPVAPEPVGPTRSRMLNAAYRIMADANPYESAQGQDMYGEGLTEQTKLDEAAAERKQKLADMGFQTDLKDYGDAQFQDRASALKERQDVIERNAEALAKHGQNIFDYGVHKEDQQFQASEKAKDRANAIKIESMKDAADAKGGGGSSWGLSPEEQAALNRAAAEGRVDVARLNSRTAKIQAGILMANPGFDAMTNHGLAALIGNAPAQQKAMMAAQLPQVLANVRDAGKKINLSDVRFAGNLQAWGKGQLNDPNFTAYMNSRNDAMMMIAQVMRGTGATDKAVQMENEAAPKSMSPKAWDAWYGAQLRSLAPRVQIMEQRKLLPAGTAASLTGTASTLASSGAITPRKPGESIADYLKRTGG